MFSVGQEVMDEANQFSGQRYDCYIVIFSRSKSLKESVQPGIACSCDDVFANPILTRLFKGTPIRF